MRSSRSSPLGASNRATSYFEQTVGLLNDHGTTPVIVLMPIHPRVLRVMREHTTGGEREQIREYLDGLTAIYDLKVIDLK